jgi:hypothetical protein
MSSKYRDYPSRPDRRGVPRSTHKASKKSRTWVDGENYKWPIDERLTSRLVGTSSSLTNNPAFDAFLAKYRHNKVPVHEFNKKGRTLLV